MTEPTRAKATRRPRRSASQLFIAALVVFGIAASALLLFSENIQWLRVGLVSALWAAIVGAFAMTKYRRDAVADQAKAKDLQTVYELQLAREISARREYELGVEARVRSEVQLETTEVAALRAELAHLRENLQLLFDGNLPTERVALRAEATRMQELGGRSYENYQAAASGLYVPGGGSQPQASTSDAESAPVAGLGNPLDEPVTAETSVLYPDVPIGSEDPGATGYSTAAPIRRRSERATDVRIPGSGRRVPMPPRAPIAPLVNEPVGSPAGPPSLPEPEPELDRQPEPEREPEPQPHPEPAYVGGEAAAEASPDPAPAPDPAPTYDDGLPPVSPRRRRRAEPEVDADGAHSNGRSVAEIMAGLQSGGSEPQTRRHRRRAD
ncbi:hypothetical protein HQ346_16125 [Rhodococcus sp. BP-252]|uniref:DUF6779 domain-containing protein n=1 Tax=unclassified Rhodococcus (in: high G+C Gram-positive bacteria) TaxID=192944 RepID=UPI001C9A521A|nr:MULTISPECIES: DUF6779 domain-containing protein [unclassified Rhodococcus (in: high G+C Gram-positive bacteria)]MBY6413249.1 hypothetical protein [Rhodococcus sp. BP-320]MBY6418728.1 hypothetical protein [Rhodococcus sp. BP-321]MBY6423022.1 hypothetical protein [Rhodococcus sp. BP-324]MBY6427992.1 hypothetical protein [Rhodococcus sp. BP-323]MBY6433170.1 hypothetical protein [Rhodococcus sp. BP-322]